MGTSRATPHPLSDAAHPSPASASASASRSTPPARPDEARAGEAGRSAEAEYRRRRDARDHRIDERWGRLAGIVKLLGREPQSTAAWSKGAEGERLVADRLASVLGDRARLLYDRAAPRTRGNIDVVAVARSGVWVIDVKHYRGSVAQRDVGGWFRSDRRLIVAGRDRTALIDDLGWQRHAVTAALGDLADVPLHVALCFVEAEWPWFAKPFQVGGGWVMWPDALAQHIGATGPLDGQRVREIAHRLEQRLPAK